MWLQKEIHLKPRTRGFHLITEELLRELPELHGFKIGMLNVFILHTSAAHERLDTLYQRKLAALDELKKSLLHQAFSGAL